MYSNNPGYPPPQPQQGYQTSQQGYPGVHQGDYPRPPYPPQPGYPGVHQESNYPRPSCPPQPGWHPESSYPPHQPYPQQEYQHQTFQQASYTPPDYPQGSYNANQNIHQARMTSNQYSYPGDDPTATFDFTEKSIRLGFIRKVYSILTVQLLIVVAFVALFVFEKKTKKYFMEHFEFVIIAIVLVIVLAIVMACCSNVRRTAPMNYICLFMFTIAFSFLVGVSAARYDEKSVMLALGLTAAITFGLTLFAFQTKIDFTGWGGALFALILVLIVGGIFAAIFHSQILHTIIAAFGALLMALYIIYDTQLMLGGNHKYSLSPEEYVFAALNLYLDIVNLFLYLLQLIGGRD